MLACWLKIFWSGLSASSPRDATQHLEMRPARTWSARELVARGQNRVAQVALEIGGVDECAEILERGDAGLAVRRRRWGFRRRAPSR